MMASSRVLLVLLDLLVLVSLASASHNMGGSASVRYKGRNPDGTFRVQIRNRDTYTHCRYNHHWACYSGNCGTSVTDQRGTIDSGRYGPRRTRNWCETESVTTRTVPTDKPFQLKSSSCCWIGTRNSVSSWRLRTLVDLGSRSDTGEPNRSPDVATLPFLRVPQNCPRSYRMMAFDGDGDQVRCRYGTVQNLECSNCNQPSGFILDQASCTLQYHNSYSHVYVHAFQLVVEDFPKKHIQLAYSDGSRSYRGPLSSRRKRAYVNPYYVPTPWHTTAAPTTTPWWWHTTAPTTAAATTSPWQWWRHTTAPTTAAPTTTPWWWHTTAPTTAAPTTAPWWWTTTTTAPTTAAPTTTSWQWWWHTTTASSTTAAPTTSPWQWWRHTTAPTTAAATTAPWWWTTTTTAPTTAAPTTTSWRWWLHTTAPTTAAPTTTPWWWWTTTTTAPTTAAATTAAPTTAAATTAARTTAAATTAARTTAAATTAWPTTAAPTTAWPTTAAPTTAAPTTAAATTAAPTTAAPTTAWPTTAAPTTAWPTTAAPTTASWTTPGHTTPPPTTVPWWWHTTTPPTTTPRLTTVPWWWHTTTAPSTVAPAHLLTHTTPLSKLPLQFSFLVDNAAPSCQEGLYLPKLVAPTPQHGAHIEAEVNKQLEIRVRATAAYATISDLVMSGPLNMTKHRTTTQEFVIRWQPTSEQFGDVFPICFAIEAVSSSYSSNSFSYGSTPQSGIYQSEMRCVLVGVQHNQTNVHVVCSASSMRVEMEKSGFSGLSEDHLQLSDPTNTQCRLQSNATHVYADIPLNACGTLIEEDDDSLLFKNEITTSDDSRHLITRMNLLEVRFFCQYSKRGNVTLGFTAHRSNVTVWERGFGTFTYAFEFFPDTSYRSMIDPRAYPLEYDLGSRVYMQIQATSTINNTELFVESCRAAPYDNPNYRPTYPIIDNGCPVDPTVQIHSPPHQNYFQFSMEAFKFIGLHDQVYISCSVLICQAGNPNTRCTRGCLNATSQSSRRRRDAVAQTNLHYVSQGPLRLRRATDTAGGAGTQLNLNVVFLCGCVLAVVGMISAVVVYKTRASSVRYRPLPTYET